MYRRSTAAVNPTFGALDLVLAGPRTHGSEPYAWASLFRDLTPELTGAADASSIAFPGPDGFPGERYFRPCAEALLRLLDNLAGR